MAVRSDAVALSLTDFVIFMVNGPRALVTPLEVPRILSIGRVRRRLCAFWRCTGAGVKREY